ncbi:hypothetical protein EN829_032490 [Mesorhizobium sp. M00.F.Ca.ET.186.01.1.1]|nr:hypothetical protein EN829_032490 [Mesorhizobium sp. M00.F.Ca.ET.186.01.1.1]
MNGGVAEGLFACAERWALALTERKSVTGTEDERSFGPWLSGKLRWPMRRHSCCGTGWRRLRKVVLRPVSPTGPVVISSLLPRLSQGV